MSELDALKLKHAAVLAELAVFKKAVRKVEEVEEVEVTERKKDGVKTAQDEELVAMMGMMER